MKYFSVFLLVFTFAACSGATQIQTPQQTVSEESSDDSPVAPAPVPKTEPINRDAWDLSDVSLSEVDKTRKLIALTFDDAPSRTMENLLATFAAYNEANPDCKAFATFFFNGYLFDNATVHLLNGALALGMELGNHTYSHLDLTALTPEKIQWEIDETDKLLQKADRKERHLLRAPFGKINQNVRAVAQAPLLDWNIDTLDWAGKSAEEIFETAFSAKADGSIVLMHDGYFPTVDALKRLLPALKAAGYQAVSISQLAKAHDCVLENGKVYIRARKPQERG